MFNEDVVQHIIRKYHQNEGSHASLRFSHLNTPSMTIVHIYIYISMYAYIHTYIYIYIYIYIAAICKYNYKQMRFLFHWFAGAVFLGVDRLQQKLTYLHQVVLI